MTYWIDKPLCNINRKCIHNNIINNINPDDSVFDNLNIYENFKKKYYIKSISHDNIDDVKLFLENNYNFHYSIDVLKMIIFNPFTNSNYNLLLYDNDMIIGTILSVEKKLHVNNTCENVVSVVLLCIHHKYRNNKLSCYLLDILIKKIKENNIYIGLFNTTHYLNNVKYIKNLFLFKRPSIKNKINILPCKLVKNDFITVDNIYYYLNDDEIYYWFNNDMVKNFKYGNNILSFIPILYKNNIVYLLFYKNIKNNNMYNKILSNILPEYDIYIYDNKKLNYNNFYLININYCYFYNYHVNDICETNFII